jgi:transposase
MGKLKPKERSVEEKVAIVLSLLRGEASAAELCRRYGTTENSLNRWRERFLEGGKAGLAGRKDEGLTALEMENRQLKEALAETVLKLEMQKNSRVFE